MGFTKTYLKCLLNPITFDGHSKERKDCLVFDTLAYTKSRCGSIRIPIDSILLPGILALQGFPSHIQT